MNYKYLEALTYFDCYDIIIYSSVLYIIILLYQYYANVPYLFQHIKQDLGKLKANKTQQIPVTTQVFFTKTKLHHI